MKRKICVVVLNRANYGRIKSVLKAIKNHPQLELQLIVGASALLDRFGSVVDTIKKDGFEINETIYMIVEGENPTTMAKSTGLAILELSTIFSNLKPDIVITIADRFETMATAVAACYMNITIAHTQGGEVTGSIDECVRHAVTKLSHIHFPATKLAKERVIKMGEDPKKVFLTGCPSIDAIANIDLGMDDDFIKRNTKQGVGSEIDFRKPYFVVLQHPVTTEYGEGYKQVQETLSAIHELKLQTMWLWPNVDAGSDDISKCIRGFREVHHPDLIHFRKNFTVEDYAKLINNCACLIGNSSSGIREGSFLGVPVVNIGSRQKGRERGTNVADVWYNKDEIKNAILKQMKHGKYPKDTLYGDGHASEKIAEHLVKHKIEIQKKLFY